MKLHTTIVDDFFPQWEGWRKWCDDLEYVDEVNPVDGVTYPGIYRDVPQWGAQTLLAGATGKRVRINAAFLRLSLAGSKAPHIVHNDASMGQYSLMVYMNRYPDCVGGTGFYHHRGWADGEVRIGAAVTIEQLKRDANTIEAWDLYSRVEMAPNRAVIFRSELMHAALPVGGFGDDARNGRLVFTAFFDVDDLF